MVAIVAGQGLGLFNTSGGVLGGAGQLGVGAQGRSGEKVLVNASTGNLVVQQQDEWLVGVGPDVGVGRTYNSLGGGTDDNGDNWRLGLSRRITGLVGTVNTAGSAITRVGEDGAEVVYSWDATRAAYVSKNGAGSFDTLSLAGGFWTWTDGDTQVKETYQVVSGVDAKLLRVVDPDGNKIELTYGGGLTSYLVTEIATWSASAATGEKVTIAYDTAAGNTSDILSITTRYLSAGVAQPDVKRVSYTYEPYTKAGQAARRLKTVTVDLTPQDSTDNATAGTTYTSTYTYVDASSSRLASLTQGDGSKLDFAYDVATSRIVSIKESVGAQVRETKFDYSVAGVTKVTDALGQITELSYETAAGQNQYQLKSIKSPAVGGVSQVQSFAYDANGNVVSVTDARGSVTTYGYDANGNRVYERDAQNNVVRRSFSVTNQLLTQTSYLDLDPDGAGVGEPTQALSTRYVYETAAGKTHQLRFAISAEGRVTEYSYNAAGQISRTFAYAAGTYGTAALAPAQVPALADMVAWAGAQSKAGSHRVDYTYDSRGQLDRKSTFGSVDAAGNGVLDGTQSVAQYVYDQAGNLLKQVDALGGITQYAYDGLNRVISQRDAAGNVTSTLYTDALRQGKVSMANGLAVVSTYDASGRVVSVSRTDAAVALGTTSYVYDALGRQRAVTGPLGEKSYTLYDAANRKVGEIDAEGALTEYIYNGNNQVVRSVQYATKVDPAKLVGDGSALVLDGATGVRPVVNGTADRVSRNIYDKAGRLTISIDALGFVQERRYDGAGRLQETLAYATALGTQLSTLAASTQELSSSRGAILAYDPATATTLTLSVPTSAADRRVRNFYSADGQLIGQLDGESRYTAYAYDGVGQLVKTTRYANTLVGSLPDGNVPPAVVAAATGVVYVLSNAINDQVTQSLYNGRDQLVGKLDAEGYYSSYQYDAAGNQVLSVRYANRVVGVFDGKTAPVVVAVGAALPASGSYVQASTEDHKLINAYDPNGRLIRSESQPTGVINTYQYDSVGNLLKSVRALGQPEEQSQQKRYDKLGRLTAELSAQGSKALAQLLTATPTATQAQIDEVWASYGLRHQYDLSGRRTSTIEPNGVDGAGIKSVYYYDKVGRLTHSINALGEVVQYDYNSFGEKLVETKLGTRLSSTVLAALSGGLASGLGTSVSSVLNASLDTKTLQEYDRRGQLSKRTDALGLFVMSQYNAFGELSTRWDRLSSGLNETTAYSYNRAGQLLQTQELLAQRTLRQVVDAFGRITQSVDALGKAASFVYDRLGRQVTNVDRTGVYHQTSYDAFGRTLISYDGQFNATTYTYDSANRKVTVTTPEGIQSVTESNRLGQSVKVTDGRGNATTYTYNADGQLLSTAAPSGLGTSTIGYDKAGRVIETRDARGVLTRTTYDAASRVLTRTQDPTGLNLSTQYRYDAKGQAIWSRDANGVWTQKEYDLKGQLIAVTVDPKRGPDWVAGGADDNPAGLALRTQYTFDAQGRTLSVIEGAGTAQARTVQYVYDAAGRRTQEIVDPAGLKLITSYTYDLNNNVTSRTDAKGQITSYIYDAENRQTYVVDATGAVTKRAYDREGRVSTSTAYATRIAVAAGINEAYVTARLVSVPARDQVTRSVYDRNGRLSHRIDAMNYVTRFEYDGAGNVVKQTRYATAASSVTLSTSLGALITWAAPVVSTSALDRVEQTSYDALGRAVYSVDAAGGVTQRTFDANGNLTKTTRFANAMTGTLATNGVPAVVADAARDQSSYSVYDNANRAIFGVDALNFVTASTYDAAGRVLSQTRYGTALASYSTGAVPAPVANAALDARISYEYDKAGRNTKVSDALGSVTLKVYDAAGRVTDVTQAHGTADASTTRYVYDAAGRVTQQVTAYGKAEAATTSYVLDALGQQTSVTAAGYTTQQVFDGAGRVISTISPLSWTTSTEYDAFGNAVKVTDPNGNAGYFYFDQLNRSTWQIDPQGYALSTRFDAFGQAEEITRYASVVAGTPVTTLTPAAYALAADATAAGSSLYVLRNATQDATTRIEHDKLGRQTRLIDAEGKAESMSYDVLGNKTGYVNKLGGAYAYTHDVLGRVLTEKAPVQVKGADGLLKDVITRFAYDAQGNVTQKTEASGLSEQRITLYGYDLNNQLKTTTGEAMSTYSVAGGDKTETPVETRSYDRRGNLIELKAADGARTLSYWDANNRKVAELNALGKLTTWSYAADGKTTAQRIYGDALALPATAGGSAPVPVNAANVRETLFTYDGNRRLTETTVKSVLQGSYDKATDSFQLLTQDIKALKAYDAAGNLVLETDARGGQIYSFYDKVGNKIAQLDAERYVTKYEYNASGKVVRSTRYATKLPAATVVSVSTPASTVLAAVVSSADDRINEVGYDRLGQVLYEQTLNVKTASVSAAGAITETNLAARTSYVYNALGLVVQKTDATGGVTNVTYDAMGHQTKLQDPSFVDFEGATVRHTAEQEFNGLWLVNRSIERGKDNAQEGDDQITTYRYGKNGLQSGLTDAQGAALNFKLDVAGRVTSKSLVRADADGALVTDTTEFVYDLAGQQTQQIVKQTPAGQAAVTLQTQETRYNLYGNIVAKGTNGGWQEFAEFDKLGRMTKSNAETGLTKAYYYDANGNATLTVDSSGTDIRSIAIDQVLLQGGVNRTYSIYDKRNLLVDTYLPTSQSQVNVVTPTQVLTQQQSIGAIAATTSLTVAAGISSGASEVAPTTVGSVAASKATPVSASFYSHYEGDDFDFKGTLSYMPIREARHSLSVNIPNTSAWGSGNVVIQVNLAGYSGMGGFNGSITVTNGTPSAVFNFGEGIDTNYSPSDVPARSYSYTLLKKVEGAADRVIGTYTGVTQGRGRGDGGWRDTTIGSATSGMGNLLSFADQNPATGRLVLLSRVAGSGSAWTVTEVPQAIAPSGKIAGRFELNWSGWARGNYEFRYFGLEAGSNRLINAEQGNFTLSDSAPSIAQQALTVGGSGKAFLDTAGALNFIGMDGAGTNLAITYRHAGTSEAYITANLAPDATGKAGWFKLATAGLSGNYEYSFTLTNATGSVLSKGNSTFTVGSADSVKSLTGVSPAAASVEKLGTAATTTLVAGLTVVRTPVVVGTVTDSKGTGSVYSYGNGAIELSLPDSSMYGSGNLRVVLHMDAVYGTENGLDSKTGQAYTIPGVLMLNALDQTYYVPNGTTATTLGFTETGSRLVDLTDPRRTSISIYKQTPTGDVYIGGYYAALANFSGWGAQERTGGAASATLNVANFKSTLAGSAATNSTRMVLQSRVAGSSSGWSVTELQRYGAAGNFILNWQGWARGNYEYRAIAMDASGNVLSASTGNMALIDGGATISVNDQFIGGAGRVFMSNTGKLNFTEQGSKSQSLQVRWRALSSNGVWSTPISLSPKVVSGLATPGWFEFDPLLYGLSGSYEYVITAKDSLGATVNQVAGSFATGNASSVSALNGYQIPAAVLRLGSLPSQANSVKVSYRSWGSTGAYTQVSLSKAGPGVFDWNTSGIFSGSGSADFEFKYESYDANGVVVQLAHGQLRLGDDTRVVSHVADSTPTLLSFMPPAGNAAAADATQLVLQYRVTGTQPYTTITLSRTDKAQPFVWNASAVIAPGASGSLDYIYTLKTAANVVINSADGAALSVPGVLKVGPAPAAAQIQLMITGVTGAAVSIHRSQRRNAFGEVDQEVDGRGNATDLTYNTLGNVIVKQDPTTTATLQNGFVKTLRPTTYFYNDAMGRAVGSKDANGNVVSQSLLAAFSDDSQAKTLSEFHLADGGIKKSGYDVFGNLRVTFDELNRRSDYSYDKADRVVRIDRPARQDGRRAYDIYEYDAAGQRIASRSTPDGSLVVRERTYYDALGRVVRNVSGEGRTTTTSYSYDATILGAGGKTVGGWVKTVSTGITGTRRNAYDPADTSLIQSVVDYTDVFGRTTKHSDMGGHVFSYSYNNAGWLMSQSGTSGQNISYTYYNNGYQKSIEDITAGSRTEYAYDANGNRTYEGYSRLVPGAANREYFQNANIAYDALNRITSIVDAAGAEIRYEYDANGNRRHVWSYYHDGIDGTERLQDLWYTYDGLNRFTITMGELVGPRATTETDTVATIKATAAGSVMIGYNKAGERSMAIYGYDGHREDYTYTADGLLANTYINPTSGAVTAGALRASRDSDLMGRVTTYREFAADGATQTSSRVSNYDKDDLQISEVTDGTTTTHVRLADGTLDRTVAVTSGTTVTTYYSYEWWDSSKESTITLQGYNPALKGNNSLWKPGMSHYTYDANGHLNGAIDEAANRSFRYVNNAQGLILKRDQMIGQSFDKWHRYYYVNGNGVGEVGNDGDTSVDYAQQLAADKSVDRKAQYRSWTPIASADFDQNYQAINSTYPGPTPGSYTARAGESLYGVAQAVWGDSTLWYLIAEANGLSSNTALKAGQVLTIPNKVTNVHNTSATTKVYNAGAAIGDTQPTMPDAPPPPKPKKGCGGLGMILMIVVAVVATVFTAGVASMGIAAAMNAGLGTIMTAGVGVMAGSAGLAGIGYAALGGAVGSAASQLVGMATGDVQKFSWSAVAMGAIGAGVGAGLPGAASFGGGVVGAGARAAVGNIVTQGIGVTVGLQEKFDWRGVAASAIGGAISHGLTTDGGQDISAATMRGFGLRVASGVINGGVRAAVYKTKPNWASIAIDSFGSALGDAVVASIAKGDERTTKSKPKVEESKELGFTRAQEVRIQSGATVSDMDPYGRGDMTADSTQGIRRDGRDAQALAGVDSAGEGGNYFGVTPADSRGFFPSEGNATSSDDQRTIFRKNGRIYKVIDGDRVIELKDRPTSGRDAFTDAIEASISTAPEDFPSTKLGQVLGKFFGGKTELVYNALSYGIKSTSGALDAGADIQAKFSAGKVDFTCSVAQDICSATLDVAGSKKELTVEKRGDVWGYGVKGGGNEREFIPSPSAENLKGVIGSVSSGLVENKPIADKWSEARQKTIDALTSLDPFMSKKAAGKAYDWVTSPLPQFVKTGGGGFSAKMGPVSLSVNANAANAVQNAPLAIADQINSFIRYQFRDTIRALHGNGSPR
jgi:YD repeat-containing protein